MDAPLRARKQRGWLYECRRAPSSQVSCSEWSKSHNTLRRPESGRPLRLMNERLIWSLPTCTNMYEESERERGRGQASPLSTSQSASNSPRLNILSAWSSFLMWNRPREEGGRETAGQDKTVVQRQSERERGKRQHSAATGSLGRSLGHSVVF